MEYILTKNANVGFAQTFSGEKTEKGTFPGTIGANKQTARTRLKHEITTL